MAAKMKLELYYKEAVEGVVGRKERYVRFCLGFWGGSRWAIELCLATRRCRWAVEDTRD